MNCDIRYLVLLITIFALGCGNIHHPAHVTSPFPQTLVYTPPETETFYCFMDGDDELCFEEIGECALATLASGSDCTTKRIVRGQDPDNDRYDRRNPYVQADDPVPPVDPVEATCEPDEQP